MHSLALTHYRSDRHTPCLCSPTKGAKLAGSRRSLNPLRTVHTFSISRPSPHTRRARGDVERRRSTLTDFTRARANAPNRESYPARIRFGTPGGINIFVGKWWKVTSLLRDAARRFDFPPPSPPLPPWQRRGFCI